MSKLLLIIWLLATQDALSQRGFLIVKKRGYKKVMTIPEGSFFRFRDREGQLVQGFLALVKGDSLRVNNIWYRTGDIRRIILRTKAEGGDASMPILLTTAGVAISTGGMTLAKWASFRESLLYSSVIGYGNYVIRFLPKTKRRYYRMGNKFSVHTLDLHF